MSLHPHITLKFNLTANNSSTSPVILDETRNRAIETLDSWNFEPSKLPEEDVLVCTIILFETLLCKEGMEDEINISLGRFLLDPCLLSGINPPIRSQFSSRPSYHIFAKSIDVRIRTTTFVMP